MQPLASEAAPDCGSSGLVVVSVVSHGHKHQVQGLLNDLVRFSRGRISRVVLTLNQPEAAPQPPAAGWPFALHIVRNIRPLGFGANHNRALSGAGEPFVCVLNPDVRWDGCDPLEAMVQAAAQPGVGCSYPVQIDNVGCWQDSARFAHARGAVSTAGAGPAGSACGLGKCRLSGVAAACVAETAGI